MAQTSGGVAANDTSHVTKALEGWLDQNWDTDLTVRQWWALLADAGWSTPAWPALLGGRDFDSQTTKAVARTLASAAVLAPPTGYGLLMGAPTLLRYGTAEQQHRFLPDL